ncbi:MAG: SurA N-terminal domain-containing protein [Candidatus Shapirobacteria bacterium]
MKNLNKIHMLHLGLLLVLLTAGGYSYLKYWNVATVNGKPIARIDFIKTLEKAGGKQTLDQMVQTSLILEEGKKNNIKMEKSEIDAEITKIEDRLKVQGQTLDAALVSSGMTRTDLEKQILMQKIETALSKPKVEISQAQIDEFIKTYKTQLPPKATKVELETIAKDELTAQAVKLAAETWVSELTKNAKVILK